MWAKLQIAALASALCLALGFGAGVAWEHRGKLPFPFSLAGDGLATRLEVQSRLALENRLSADSWRNRAEACDRARQAETQSQAQQIGRASADADGRGAAAFNNGYAAGRVAGARSCRGTNATESIAAGGAPGAAPGVRLDPGGVLDDFAASFNAGAYRAGADLPGGR